MIGMWFLSFVSRKVNPLGATYPRRYETVISLSALFRRRNSAAVHDQPWSLAHPAVDDVAHRAEKLRKCSDAQLAVRSGELRIRLRQAENRNLDAQIEAGAIAMEAVRRTTNKELFATQRLAGLVLSHGMIAEMHTGEGKTLSAALPIHYGAVLGGGVHVMTTNPYLAQRDAEILRPALSLLGVSVGLLMPDDDDRARQKAYACDVTYGAGYEFGFDYLRDQIVVQKHDSQALGATIDRILNSRGAGPKQRQRGLCRAIIDEVDSILLDEGTVPLLLSGPSDEPDVDDRPYRHAQEVGMSLAASDFQVDRARARARLTEKGRWAISASLGRLSGVKLDRPWHDYIEKALTANFCLDRDIQYVVVDDKAVIVDEFTGRLQADRSWKDGLHQAVETKEQLPLSRKNRTLAQTSRQRLLRRYESIAGMTGTADGSDAEMRETYGVDVVRVPTIRPSLLKYLPDRFFVDAACKWEAAVAEIASIREQGRPVLVGSRTIQVSRKIARMLEGRGIECQVLNGLQTADEAELVAVAGERGRVTVATNMAGRGTDIRLGPGVAELGGLHVLGLERSVSPRIDGQLAGRVARQGDPGSCQFFVSADDALIQEYAPQIAEDMALRADLEGEVCFDFSSQVERAQLAAEEQARQRRRQLRDHDVWLNDTLKRLYGA